MNKKIVHKGKQILEDKRAIRQCIQTGGDIKNLQKNAESNSLCPYEVTLLI